MLPRLITRLVLLLVLGVLASDVGIGRIQDRVWPPAASAEILASWGEHPGTLVLRQAATMQAAETQQAASSRGYDFASGCYLAAENGASSALNGARLRTQLAAEEIAGGHAYGKHVIKQGEFPGITSPKQFAREIERIMTSPSEMRHLSNGRTAYWDNATNTVVIRNPAAADGGTAFRPTAGKSYFDNLK